MKIRNYLMGVLIFISAFFIFGTIQVHAEKYTGEAIWPSEYISDVYLRKERPDGYKQWKQARFMRRSEDNKFVYCIQPYTDINNNHTYNIARSDWWTVANLSEAQWKRISLIAYYGYQYSGHSEHKWYAVTQLMIWRTTNPESEFYFTDTLNGNRTTKYDDEIAEIESLVQRHMIKPNIQIENNTISLGNNLTVADSNGVLSDYSVTSSNNLTVTKSGNNLTIKPTAVGDATITFKKSTTKYDSYPILYYVDGSQNVVRVGNYDPVSVKLNLRVIGGKLTLHKLDRDSGENVPTAEGSLENAVYGIYDMADNLITTITTDREGNVTSDYLPNLGIYQLKEITSSKGYLLDDKVYTFEITEDNLYPEMNVYEQIIKRKIRIHKYYAKGETGTLTPEDNVKFEIYNNKNEMVVDCITDENGYCTFTLAYGSYTGKQITSKSGYLKVDDFNITINENSEETINLSFTNAPVKARLKLIKTDAESNLPILASNVTFKLFDVDNNKYVCQKITYPKKEEICEYKTDENGVFLTPYEIITGNYRIEELTSPSGYLLNQDNLTFRLDDLTELKKDEEYGDYFEISYLNQEIKGMIEITKYGETIKNETENVSQLLRGNSNIVYYNKPISNVEISLYAKEDIKTLDGIIHYNAGDLVEKINTKSNGKAIFENLYLGKYIIKETKTLDTYLLDETEYTIELNEIDNRTAIVTEKRELYNKLKKGSLEFTKTDLVNGETIPNTKIDIFTEDDLLVYSGLTDENGKITIEELPIGKYYILESEAATGYLITEEKVLFEIKENGEIVKANMTNKPVTGTLEFSKVDFSTSEPLPNTKIQIFKDDDTLIFEGITDEEGKIIIEELRYGRYYIKELEAPNGYQLNSEKMYFEILEDGEIVKCTMKDEVVTIDVPNTELNDTYLVEIVGSIMIILGIGVIIYEAKKKK